MTLDDKISMLLRNLWIGDELAERLAGKLNSDDVADLCQNAVECRKGAVEDFCERLMKMPRQRHRLAEIERLSKKESENGRESISA